MSVRPAVELTTPPSRQRDVRARVTRYALAAFLMAGGVGLWVYTDAWLTPAVEQITVGQSDPGELHLWMQDQRELAMALVVVGLILAIRHRARIAAASLVGYVGLFIVDGPVDARGMSGRSAAFAMIVGAVVALAVAGSISMLVGRRRRSSTTERRVTAAVAIAAALLAPMPAIQFENIEDFARLPAGLVPSGIAVMALLWCAAVALAATIRVTPLSVPAAVGYVLIPIAVLVAAGLPWAVWRHGVMGLAAPLLAVVVLAVIYGRRWIRTSRWLLLGAAAVVAAIPYTLAAILLALVFGGTSVAASGYECPADGVPIIPGALPVAVIAGLFLARGAHLLNTRPGRPGTS